MKTLLAVSMFALFAANASAQVVRPDANGIVYSLSALPPIVSNNRISYAPGSPYADGKGVLHACSTSLVYDHTSGAPRATCPDTQVNNNAADLANLAPAAGGPQPLSDRNLSSDRSTGLPNDHPIFH